MPAPFAFLVARLCRLPSTPDNTIKLWNMASGRELGAVPTENLVWPHSSSRAHVTTCYATSSYVVHFKCALNFGEPQESLVLEVSCAVCGAEPSNEKQIGNHAWRTARQMLHYGSEELFASRVDHKFERSLHGTILIGGDCVSLLREPDAANPHVRFDERGVETEAWRS